MTATDRAGGVLQGAADTVQGTAHEVRSGDREQHPSDREAAAHERWASGLPARNQFERDHFASAEANLTAGMDRLTAAGRQASAMEAAMTAEANREAGS